MKHMHVWGPFAAVSGGLICASDVKHMDVWGPFAAVSVGGGLYVPLK